MASHRHHFHLQIFYQINREYKVLCFCSYSIAIHVTKSAGYCAAVLSRSLWLSAEPSETTIISMDWSCRSSTWTVSKNMHAGNAELPVTISYFCWGLTSMLHVRITHRSHAGVRIQPRLGAPLKAALSQTGLRAERYRVETWCHLRGKKLLMDWCICTPLIIFWQQPSHQHSRKCYSSEITLI